MTYQVLARTWRPQRFDDLLGQEAVVQTLRNALEGGTVGHAYLFSGLRGVGKTTVARLLAKAVNCVQGPTADPCDECVSCHEIAAGSSLDMVELDGASNRGIDDVRELRELLRYRPSRDRYRVIIVDEVHMLTREAFNALLKSLEEPPPHILFVLATTERHKVPATILSRCQQLEFRPVGSEQIRQHLVGIAEQEDFVISSGAAEVIARTAEGSVRDALSLLDQLRAFSGDEIDDLAVATVLGVPRFEVMVGLVEALAGGDAARGLEILRNELREGHDATVLYQETGRVLRTLVHLAIDVELETTLTDDQRAVVRPLAERLGADALGRMLGLWLEQESLMRESSNRELAVEVAALRLTRWPTVQRVERLLAGDAPVRPPETSTPSPGSAQAPPDRGGGAAGEQGSAPGDRLTRALWRDQPRLASAVESARVTVDASTVILRFGHDAEPLAQYVRTEAWEAITAACRTIFSPSHDVSIEVAGPEAEGGSGTDLEGEAGDDPQLQLALRVLGGEVVAVRDDRGAD
jgi:DNA polymerase-3 subunit gamma/tau